MKGADIQIAAVRIRVTEMSGGASVTASIAALISNAVNFHDDARGNFLGNGDQPLLAMSGCTSAHTATNPGQDMENAFATQSHPFEAPDCRSAELWIFK